MIPIVVHGILGTTYGQNVVVDEEVRENGSLQVLYDIRRQLSMQYGDDTPMTSWALQPAPTGMWLTHIERAFDINYAPGYIAFSFLIPHGRQPKSTAMLKLIKNTLNQNHSKYIQQGVTQNISDWSFLKELSADLEAYMTHTDVAAPVTQPSTKYGIAYSEGDAVTLLDNLWDSRVAQCRMVFCGREILTADKEFMALEDIPLVCESKTIPEPEPIPEPIPEPEPKSKHEPEPEPTHVAEDNVQEQKPATEVVKGPEMVLPPEVEEDKMEEQIIHPIPNEDIRKEKPFRKFFVALISILAVALAAFLIGFFSHHDSKTTPEKMVVQIDTGKIQIENQKDDYDVLSDSTTSTDRNIPPKEVQEEPINTPQQDLSLIKKYYYAHNYNECLPLAQKYANLGYAEAQYFLANMYRRGYALPRDTAEALKWYRKAAAQNHRIAQCSIGYFYHEGFGVPQDYYEAVKWYRKSVAQGFSIAQWNLGLCYEFGEGVDQNYLEAKKWYQKAADQGHQDAKTRLYIIQRKIDGTW